MLDNDHTGLDLAVGREPPGLTAIGVFLFFGAVMASLAATTLLWRGTAHPMRFARSGSPSRRISVLAIGVYFARYAC
jgi:hypothetical protein